MNATIEQTQTLHTMKTRTEPTPELLPAHQIMNKNKNTIDDLVKLMEDNNETPKFIIKWLTNIIQGGIDGFHMQLDIDGAFKYYHDKANLDTSSKLLERDQWVGDGSGYYFQRDLYEEKNGNRISIRKGKGIWKK